MEAAPAFVEPKPSPRMRGIRAVLAIAALFEVALGSEIYRLAVDARWAIIYLLVALLALAALVFAVWGRVRHAVLALGAAVLMHYMPWMLFLMRQKVSGPDGLFWSVPKVSFFITPLLATIAIALVAQNQRLTFAAMLVCIPILFNLPWLLLIILVSKD